MNYKCNFCDGFLGDIIRQEHSNPDFAEYRVCLKCNYQWAKKYWETDCKPKEVQEKCSFCEAKMSKEEAKDGTSYGGYCRKCTAQCDREESQYFDYAEKQEAEAISNLDDCNPLGVMVL